MKSQDLKKFKLPDSPGVYFFSKRRITRNGRRKTLKKEILYIGKATSLRGRVKSYFSKDLIKTRGPLIVKMVSESGKIEFQKTGSVLEALLLEADLIKKFKPFYNTDGKDDKSGNCIVITDEDFPRVLVVRQRELDSPQLLTTNYKLQTVFGPYPNGGELREALKIIRRIFLWRDDKCIPCFIQRKSASIPRSSAGRRPCRPCFNRQIGLCPGVCTGEISKSEYRKIINRLKLLFRGRVASLLGALEKEMNVSAKKQDFEGATELKRAIFALRHIQDISLIKKEKMPSVEIRNTPFRIEAYDIAHISGTNMVGAMTVIEGGEPKKSDYRKFKIRSVSTPNDPAALSEVLTRRFNHPEWPLPDLIVVDGNEVQKGTAEKIVTSKHIESKIVSVVKDAHHKPREILGLNSVGVDYKSAILLANSEAHRFAISYHRQSRRLSF